MAELDRLCPCFQNTCLLTTVWTESWRDKNNVCVKDREEKKHKDKVIYQMDASLLS